MLKIIPRRKRVPDALALLGALLLAAGALGGAGHSLQGEDQRVTTQSFGPALSADAQQAAPAAPVESAEPMREAAVTTNRRFRVSLFLFRH